MNWLEIAGVAVGLVYLWLEYRASLWLWLAGIIMPAIYIFVYYDAEIYADMGINIYYLLAGLYGWLMWVGRKDKTSGEKKIRPITRTPKKQWFPLFLVAAGCFMIIARILVNYTDSNVPYADSFTTALSIVGMWMLAQKYVEQWLVWIVVDAASCLLYIYKGLHPTAALYGLYSIIAVFGYLKWVKTMKEQQNDTVAKT